MKDKPFEGMSAAEIAWADQKFARASTGVDGMVRLALSPHAPETDVENMMLVVQALESLPDGEKRIDMITHWFAVAVTRLARCAREHVE